jgi:hypothetical protein
MISLAIAWMLQAEAPERTPAVYRCPAKEAESARLEHLLNEEGFDALCVDPKPGPLAVKVAKGKVRFMDSKAIDTKANMSWRNATIAFASGKMSPKQWVAATAGLHETIHFLSSPKTKDLRDVMSAVPVDPGGTFSAASVFAEIFLLAQPGRPCLTSTDIWETRELPDAGRLQSWVLAMRDLLGPMLSYRHDNPFMVTGKPTVIRADAKPGLLIFRQSGGKKTLTFYFNNSDAPVKLPKVNMEKVTINGGMNLDGPEPVLNHDGFLIEES